LSRSLLTLFRSLFDTEDNAREAALANYFDRKQETVTLAEQEENTLIRGGVVLRAEHLFRSQTGDSYTGSTRDLLLNKKRPTIQEKETYFDRKQETVTLAVQEENCFSKGLACHVCVCVCVPLLPAMCVCVSVSG
jgi:hypothetical protein